MTADSLLVFGFCSILIAFLVFYLLADRRAIRNRRLRKVEGLFDSATARTRRLQLNAAFNEALSLLEQGDDIVRRGREGISSLAPVVPPPVSAEADASELRSRMVECLEQDFKAWKIGGTEEFLHGLVDASGQGVPELLQETLASLKDRMAEHPGELLEIAKHVFGTILDPKENAGAAIDHGQALVEPQNAVGVSDAVQVSGSTPEGGVDAGGIDSPGIESPGIESSGIETPIVAVEVAAPGERRRGDRRRSTPGRAYGNASLDGTGTGGGAVPGGRFRSIPILGPLVGAFLGRRVTDFKRRPDRDVRRAYESAVAGAKSAEDESMRKTYEKYREVAIEQAAVFESQIREFPLPSESPGIGELVASMGRAAQEDYRSESHGVRVASERAVAESSDAWFETMLGLGISREARRLLAGKIEREITILDAEYGPFTHADELSIQYLERVGRTAVREGGALERAVERAAIRIELGLPQSLEEFVLWSIGARVAHEQSLKKLIEAINGEAQRHAKEMDARISRLNSLKEELDREVGGPAA
jgi:hypothetical protein